MMRKTKEDDFDEELPSRLSLGPVDEAIIENDGENFESESEGSNDEEEDDEEEEDEVMLTEQDLQPTYHDSLHTIFGCSHYQTNCKIECQPVLNGIHADFVMIPKLLIIN